MKVSLTAFFSIGLLCVALISGGCGGGGSASSDDESSSPIDGGGSTSNGGALPQPLPADSADAESVRVYDEPIPLLVIRIAYTDRSFVNDAATWQRKIFGKNFHQLNSYYLEVSNGKFEFLPANESEGTRDGIITVTLNKPHPDPGLNERNDIHADLSSAVWKADPYIDFSDYDQNKDQIITKDELQVMFIIAGYEDAYSGGSDAPGIWAHSHCLNLYTPYPDSVSLLNCTDKGGYSLFGERHGNHDATIGVIAHELGHAIFGLPDLYDTDGSSSGVGYFDLMSTGTWGYSGPSDLPGNTPVHFSAWSKIVTGWVTPSVAANTNDQSVTLVQSASSNYNVVQIPITKSEYFLLENRDNSGYDQGLYALVGTFNGGMAIWHIDVNTIKLKNSGNTVNNNEAHKGVDLEEAADAWLDSGNDNGNERNLYYAENVSRFDPTTNPNSDSYDNTSSGIYVTDISSRGVVMHATVTNPNSDPQGVLDGLLRLVNSLL